MSMRSHRKPTTNISCLDNHKRSSKVWLKTAAQAASWVQRASLASPSPRWQPSIWITNSLPTEIVETTKGTIQPSTMQRATMRRIFLKRNLASKRSRSSSCRNGSHTSQKHCKISWRWQMSQRVARKYPLKTWRHKWMISLTPLWSWGRRTFSWNSRSHTIRNNILILRNLTSISRPRLKPQLPRTRSSTRIAL